MIVPMAAMNLRPLAAIQSNLLDTKYIDTLFVVSEDYTITVPDKISVQIVLEWAKPGG